MKNDSLTDSDMFSWRSCQQELHKLYLEEEMYWQQRSKLKWLLEGDLNTKFFHIVASTRKKNNTITSLEIDGVVCTNQSVIQKHITDFYKDLMGSSTPRLLHLKPNLWHASENLTYDQCAFLEAPFTLEEIHRVVFACNPNKASGPDGMSFQFYHSFWDILKEDLLLFQAFYDHNLDVSKFNLASICLIPKKRKCSYC